MKKKEHTDIDGTCELKELLHGIVDVIYEIAEDSHSYLIVNGRIGELKAQVKKLNPIAKKDCC